VIALVAGMMGSMREPPDAAPRAGTEAPPDGLRDQILTGGAALGPCCVLTG
jgi:hypothetical protein